MTRLLIVWLLVCALPAQALAAVSMLHCPGAGSHGHGSRAVHAVHGAQAVQADHGLHGAHAVQAPSAAQSAPHAVPEAFTAQPVTADAAGQGADAQGRCSACAACCLAAAPLADALVQVRAWPGRSVGTWAVPAFESAVVALPERPPRRPFG